MNLSSRPGRLLSAGPRHVLRAVVAALAAALVLTACSSDPAPLEVDRDAVRDGGTLRLSVATLPTTFNRWAAPLGDTVDTVLEPTRGSAVQVDDDGSWSVDERYASAVEVVATEPFTVAVTLNPEAVWSDGTPIDVTDMQAFAAAQIAPAGQLSADVDGWSVVAGVDPGADEWSYSVRFTRPTADWPRFVYPGLPAESTGADAYNAYTDTAPPSNGPFVVASIDREGGLVRLERNPAWWGDAPALDAVEYRVLGAEEEVEAFADGRLDAMRLTPAAAAAEDDDALPTGMLTTSPGREWSHLTLNAASGPLASPLVRQAVALSVDREALVADTGRDAALAGSLVTVPGEVGHADTLEPLLARDLDRARELLAEAGYTEDGDGWAAADGTPLQLRLPVPEGNEAVAARAEAIADDLGEAGIGVDIEPRPVETFFPEVVVPLDFDLVTFLWSTDPLDTAASVARVQPVDGPVNFTGLADPNVVAAATALMQATDPEAFAAAAVVFDEAVAATAVIVPLVVEPQALAVGEDVVNLVARRFGTPDWTRVGFRAE